jgi:mono/diheme cytochrome c family protein
MFALHALRKSGFACLWLGVALAASAAEAPSFNRDVLPILSDNCFACHGPDAKQAKGGLRLDLRDSATKPAKSGEIAIIPGKPSASALVKRIEAKDADKLMPPADSHKKLSSAQKDVLKRWVAAGAKYEAHWAFVPPVKAALPSVQSSVSSVQSKPGRSGPSLNPDPLNTEYSHPIDRFVLARLAQEKLTPSPEAAPHTLIRRLSFDLTGLPPTPAEVDAFVREFSLSHSPTFSPAIGESEKVRKRESGQRAVTKLVDRLLASPHFGERMAMWWLDAARYADTDGYQADATRSNWPWRDWVVAAFNANMKFDQFTREQFAGDLLPNATPEQQLATCFHRNHMTNGEGGRDPEESRVDYVIDRVNTVGTVWLGLTLNCVQCHAHKFDPLPHADFYRLAAFFNSIDEDGKAGGGAKPYLSYQSPHAARAVTEAQSLVDARKPREAEARKVAEGPFADWLATQAKAVAKGFSAWHPLRAAALESVEGTRLEQSADSIVQASGPNPNHEDYRIISPVKLPRVTGLKLEVLPHASHTGGGLSRGKSGEFILTDIKVQVRRRGSSQIRDILVTGAVADASADQKGAREYGDIKGVLDDDPRNGWTTKGLDPKQPRTAVFALAEPLVLDADEELIFELRHRSTLGDANIGRFRASVTDQAGAAVREVGLAPMEELAALVRSNQFSVISVQSEGTGSPKPAQPTAAALNTEHWSLNTSPKLRARLFDQFLADHAPYQVAKSALDRANRQLSEVKAAAGKLNVMVLAERKEPRATHILLRGVWDKPGEKVERGVPGAVAPWPSNAETTRLGLANWLTSRDNPLTARVVVNNLWALLFGNGLVRTPEDFGLQGERPTHPELLDWLAVEFMESGWDVKHLLKLMATSATYRQSSAVSPALLARDPENRLLARAPRFRLPAWMLRDGALRSSGLMNAALGGPPVRPHQPEGVWEEIFMGRFKYEPSEGAAQHRRSLYAFWRRSIAPTFLFDSAQRRVCEVRTPRTNTPLQALTLLNDETFLEASRALAAGVLRREAKTEDRLAEIYRNILARPPSAKEAAVLQREFERALALYQAKPDEAKTLLASAQRELDNKLNVAEAAAYTVVASLVFNLDEAITHE